MDNQISSDIPQPVIVLLTQLDVLINMPNGSKFNVRNSTYSNAWAINDRLLRYLTGESGQKTINHINHLIDSSINLARTYPGYSDLIIRKVCDMKGPLTNLANMYIDQPTVKSQFNISILRVNKESLLKAVEKPDTSSGASIPESQIPLQS